VKRCALGAGQVQRADPSKTSVAHRRAHADFSGVPGQRAIAAHCDSIAHKIAMATAT